MAKPQNDFVDITSSADMKKVYSDERRAAPVKRKRKGAAGRITCLILSLIMLLGGTGLVYYYQLLDKLNYKEVDTGTQTTVTDNSNQNKTKNTQANTPQPLSNDSVLNILLFGQDSPGDGESFGRSDTTILLSIDSIHKKLKLTSFQRDTYVSIPGHGANKINSAFSLGGEGLSIQTIESNFGVKVDKYATVDFDSFREIIGVLGGVDIELTKDEIKYINAQIDVNDQTDRTSFLTYDETVPDDQKQLVHLDGYQALWYARDRGSDSLGGNPEYSFSGDDWDRTSRQRNLLETIVKSLRKEASVNDLVAIVNKVGPLVTTNLKKSDINLLVTNIMTLINYDMEELSVPTTGNWSYANTEDGQSVIRIDNLNQVRNDIANFIFEDTVSKK